MHKLQLHHDQLEHKLYVQYLVIGGRVGGASATEAEDTGSIPGRIKP